MYPEEVSQTPRMRNRVVRSIQPFIHHGRAWVWLRQQTLLLKALVAEKELRLREGMQMMGLQSSMYWISWFTTHFSTLLLTMVACTLISTSDIRPPAFRAICRQYLRSHRVATQASILLPTRTWG